MRRNTLYAVLLLLAAITLAGVISVMNVNHMLTGH